MGLIPVERSIQGVGASGNSARARARSPPCQMPSVTFRPAHGPARYTASAAGCARGRGRGRLSAALVCADQPSRHLDWRADRGARPPAESRDRLRRPERGRARPPVSSCAARSGRVRRHRARPAAACRMGPLGLLPLALLASTLLAQRSLYEHVAARREGLEHGGLAEGRKAVSMIVGRNPEKPRRGRRLARRDREPGGEFLRRRGGAGLLARQWPGLPGIAPTRRSTPPIRMIGHRTPRHLAFGWAAARLDDLVNLPASRLTALLIVVGAGARPERRMPAAPGGRCGATPAGTARPMPAGRRRRWRARWACARGPAHLWRRHRRRLDGRWPAPSHRRRHPAGAAALPDGRALLRRAGRDRGALSSDASELDPLLRLHAGREMVLHSRHLGHEVGGLDQRRLGVAAGDDDVEVGPAGRRAWQPPRRAAR